MCLMAQIVEAQNPFQNSGRIKKLKNCIEFNLENTQKQNSIVKPFGNWSPNANNMKRLCFKKLRLKPDGN